MGRWKKNSKERQIKNELKSRFLEQEKITLKDATQEYYEPSSPYAFLVAERKMKAIFNAIKRDFEDDLIPFGALNDDDEHGLPNSKEEYQFMGIKRYKLVKGVIRGSKILVSSGVKRRLIQQEFKSESVPVPLLNGNSPDKPDQS